MNSRLEKLRTVLNTNNIDACIISGRPNTIYFSGFTGTTSFLLVGMDKAWLIVDFRYTIQAKKQVFEGITVIESKDTFYSAINDILKRNPVRNVGFEGRVLPYSEYIKLKERVSRVKEFVGLDNDIDRIRQIKDSDEAEILQEAALIGDKVFSHILDFIKPGMKETDISTELEYTMKKLGAKGPSFETIVASGHRSAMCHGTATDNVLKKGDALVLDFGVVYRNYCSDMTRTIFIGDPGEELKEIYNIVLKAQRAALDGIIPGMSGIEADKIARDIITEAGYGEAFGHSLGHGIGIEIHENPRLSAISMDVLEEGMVFSVEPGIYVDGLGGVRIEDMVMLMDGKLRNFTTSSKDLIII
jgi:Xaa-Pro aminopeptidase